MNILTEAHKKLLIDLLEHGVEFLVIGGYAVNFHGYPRYTLDMDLLLNPDDINKRKFISFLIEKNFSNQNIEQLRKLDFSKVQAFHIGKEESRIDFLTKIAGVDFDDAFRRCSKLPLDTKIVPVLQFEDLITNKMLSTRPKDKADVDELRKIRRYTKNE